MTLDLRPYTEPRPAVSCWTPLAERLASAIDYSGDEVCWEWRGYIMPNGYGQISVESRLRYVHRVVYELLVGPIPKDLILDHTCHNLDSECAGGYGCRHRRCCNPAHMEPVTQRVNNLRGKGSAARQVRQTHCIRGHPFDEANTYRPPAKPHARVCRKCHAGWAQKLRDRKDEG